MTLTFWSILLSLVLTGEFSRADAKSPTSYFLGPTFFSIIVQLQVINSKSRTLPCWGHLICSKICCTGISPTFVQKYKIIKHITASVGSILQDREMQVRGNNRWYFYHPPFSSKVKYCIALNYPHTNSLKQLLEVPQGPRYYL